MTRNCILVNVAVPRNADTPQVLRDNAVLPEGYIRWTALSFVDYTNPTTTAYVGFLVNGQLIPLASSLALAALAVLSLPGIFTVTNDYIPVAWVTGGVAADLLQFVAIGEVLRAVPEYAGNPTPY